MALKLMYITNRPDVAKVAETAGVDRIFVDMEYIGKDERQSGLDTVKSHHTVEDVRRVREAVSTAELLVRINPIHDKIGSFPGSKSEIDAAIGAGADILMLPMFKSVEEVERFRDYVGGRAKTMLLLETPEAAALIDQIVEVKGVDSFHIGLNDLHLAMHRQFMFELLADGTVDRLCGYMKRSGKEFGFGGIARIGYGILPAEYIIREHYRIGSTQAILSRTFCNVDKLRDIEEIAVLFKDEMVRIRDMERQAVAMEPSQFETNRIKIKLLVAQIVNNMRGMEDGSKKAN